MTGCTSSDPGDHQGDTCPVHEGDRPRTHHFESVADALGAREEMVDGDVAIIRDPAHVWHGAVLVVGVLHAVDDYPGWPPAGIESPVLGRAIFAGSYRDSYRLALAMTSRANRVRRQLTNQDWRCVISGKLIRDGDRIVRLGDRAGLALADAAAFPAPRPPAGEERVQLVCSCGSTRSVDVDADVAANIEIVPACCGVPMAPSVDAEELFRQIDEADRA